MAAVQTGTLAREELARQLRQELDRLRWRLDALAETQPATWIGDAPASQVALLALKHATLDRLTEIECLLWQLSAECLDSCAACGARLEPEHLNAPGEIGYCRRCSESRATGALALA